MPRLIHIENGGPLSALPGLCPLVEDVEVRSLRRKYVGHLVWGYGGIGRQCVQSQSGVGLDNEKPCRLVTLVRIGGTRTLLSIGTKPGVIGEAAQSEFTTSAPLVAILTPAAHAEVTGFIGESDFRLSKCRILYAEFAGAWDFEQTYSLISPRVAGRFWPRTLRKRVLAGELCAGMTSKIVAWTLGCPAAYGTVAQVKALLHWEYDNLPPFHYDADFKNSKVASYGIDGELP